MSGEDKRSKKFIFIPFCLLCQAFQAKGLVKYDWHGMIKPIVEELVKQDINLVQMPCPESQFEGYKSGLNRNAKGINAYDVPAFRDLCNKLALETVDIMKAVITNDYEIIAILGIENSPSCSVKYQYTENGTIHRQGIFIETLRSRLEKEGILIPFVGINRRGIGKSLDEIRELFNKNKQMKLGFL